MPCAVPPARPLVDDMWSRLNIAAGIAIFLATVIYGFVFVVTMFSFNAGVMFTGLVFTGLAALVLFTLVYQWTAPTPWRAYGEAGVAVLGIAHLVLGASNLVAVIYSLPVVYGAILDPKASARLPVTGSGVITAVALSTVLSFGILAATNRRRNRVG